MQKEDFEVPDELLTARFLIVTGAIFLLLLYSLVSYERKPSKRDLCLNYGYENGVDVDFLDVREICIDMTNESQVVFEDSEQ